MTGRDAVCAICGARFRPKRQDARLCSARCRQRAHRACATAHVTDNRADDASSQISPPVAAAIRAPIDLRTFPGRCPVCGMATGERDPYRSEALPDVDVGGMLHHECAAWLAAGRGARRLAA